MDHTCAIVLEMKWASQEAFMHTKAVVAGHSERTDNMVIQNAQWNWHAGM